MRFLAPLAAMSCLTLAASFAAGAATPEQNVGRWADESRKLALQVSRDYKDQLIRELKSSGPVRAIVACKYACPDILSSQSRKTGWKVAMVSLKPRNSALGMPDAWEQTVLLDFNRRLALGEDGAALEFVEVVKEPHHAYFRYARAILVEPLCLNCHGAPGRLKEAVKVQLAIDYPFDKAVGFSLGKVYGIVSIKREL